MKLTDRFFPGNGIHRAITLILVLTSLVYANSLTNSFVWDDFLVIVDNDFVKSWNNFPSIFTKAYLTTPSDVRHLDIRNIGSGEASYRPVVTISYFIDYSFWKLNAFGYHLTNLVLHLLNVVLVYFFINILTKNRTMALLGSMVFGIHPTNTEAVNSIAFREDLFSLLFFLSSFIFFIKSNDYNGRKKTYCQIISVSLFFLALFSKEMSVTLPLMIILYDYFFVVQRNVRDFFARFYFRYIGYIAVLLFYVWIRFFLMVNVGEATVNYPGGSFYTNVLTMLRVVGTYIKWLFLPVDIHTIIPSDGSLVSYSFFDPWVLLSMALIAVCFTIAIKTRRIWKEISFGILWFFVTLVPVANVFPIANFMAIRYLYIPVVGFCLVVSILLFRLNGLRVFSISADMLRNAKRGIVIGLLIFYAISTIMRNFSWKSNTVLWSEIVENYPKDAVAHTILGYSFKKIRSLDDAISEYSIAIRLGGNSAENHNHLGVCYYEKKMLDEAIGEFKKAVELDQKLVDAYNNLGCSLGEKGAYRESIYWLKQAIKIDAKYAQAYSNLGVTYARMTKWDEARNMWEKALKIDPQNKNSQENLEKLKKLRRSGSVQIMPYLGR